jgi:hypothetical protein
VCPSIRYNLFLIPEIYCRYSQSCIIASVTIGILLLIIIAILLAVLLTRSKNDTITSKSFDSRGKVLYFELYTTFFLTDKSAVLRWNSTGLTVAGVTGQFGNASNYLNVPFGLAFDWSNTLYIADWSNHRVQKYLIGSSFGVTVAGQPTGVYNSTSNFLYYPGDVAVDGNDNVYVADTYNNRIQFWKNGSSSGVTVAGTGK